MEKIRFTASVSIYDVNFNYINSKVIQLTLINTIDESVISSGFEILNEHNFIPQGDYKAYTTIYRKMTDNIYQLSNNGSVYVEPEPIPEPEPYVPTLEEVRSNKLNEISNACANMINAGVDVEINGVIEHFDYQTAEDQANIKELFDGALATGLSAPYHSSGNACKLYTANDIIEIYVACVSLKTSQTTYHNQLKMYVETLDNIADVTAITYGQALTGEYLTSYNTLMAQAEVVIKALISGRVVNE